MVKTYYFVEKVEGGFSALRREFERGKAVLREGYVGTRINGDCLEEVQAKLSDAGFVQVSHPGMIASFKEKYDFEEMWF